MVIENQVVKRELWANKAEFFLATLGYCVGIGALTRFPYVCMKNGGGAFLVPFIIVMVTAGAPLFYLELILGQFSAKSPLALFPAMMPAFRGLGLSISLLSGIVALYYMPLTWSTIYLVNCFTGLEVPWKTCGNWWNTDRCFDSASVNRTLTNSSIINGTTQVWPVDPVSPTEEFWNENILGITDSIDNIGGVRWQLAAAHAFAWTCVFLCTMRGVSSAGKVVYVTATLPFLLITILLIYGATLPGSYDGMYFFLWPKWEKLLDHNVWLEASIQVIYQLGPAWGGVLTMASYNKFKNKCYVDAVVITGLNFFTAIYGGLTIFCVLGFMAHRSGVPVKDVAKSGPGLAFVAYPEALAQLPYSSVWAVIFFLTIMTVGIDSQFGMFDTLLSGIFDCIPRLRRWKTQVTAIFAVCCFCLGLPFCTGGGMYIYQIVDWYAAALTFTMIGLAEVVIVAYIYGLKRFCYDAEMMFGFQPGMFTRVTWFVVTPAVLGILLFLGVWNVQDPIYKYTDYHYPQWAILMGWCIGLISFLPTPIIFVYVLIATPGSLAKRMNYMFKPTESWVPNDPELAPAYSKRWHFKVENDTMPSQYLANGTAEEKMPSMYPIVESTEL